MRNHIQPGSYEIFKPNKTQYSSDSVLIKTHDSMKLRYNVNLWASNLTHNSDFSKEIQFGSKIGLVEILGDFYTQTHDTIASRQNSIATSN